MPAEAQEVVLLLEKDNYEFKKLKEEHREYHEKLERIQNRPVLSAEEQYEVANLKKMKLRLKDKMAEMIREHSP